MDGDAGKPADKRAKNKHQNSLLNEKWGALF